MANDTRAVLRLTAESVRPHGALVLTRLQVPAGAALSNALCGLLDEAAGIFDRTAVPAVVFDELPLGEFQDVYAGAGQNEPRTPLPMIARQAGALALFAGTLGAGVDAAIAASFRAGDAALGCVLDACASLAAERLAERAAACFHGIVEPRHADRWFVLPYSPGYCGWNVSGQQTLFDRLRPAEIGVAVNASSMMTPIKSVSGVLVAAPREAHRFSPNYPFCDACTPRQCLDRMSAMKAAS